MNDNLYEALEDCLIALERGADIGVALERFPEMADELRPLLEASIRARSLAFTEVPVEAVRRGRANLLQHAAVMREAQQKPSRPGLFFWRLGTALAMALVIFLSGNGLVRASNGALPGDNLYPVKRTWEDVRLAFVVNPENREELETEFEQERLEEVDELLTEGRHEPISFAGIVMQQDGNLWEVSGIPVKIVETSQLPSDPIEVGMFVTVEGLTNMQGFVEADNVKILDFIGFVTPMTPVEINGTLEAEPRDSQESEMQDDSATSREKIEGEAIQEDANSGESDGSERESIESESQDKSGETDKGDSGEDNGGSSEGGDSESHDD